MKTRLFFFVFWQFACIVGVWAEGENVLARFANQENPQESRKFALLVGVTDYTELSKLSYCVNGVHAVRKELIKLDFKPEDIHILSSGSNEFKHLPTRKNFEKTLDSILLQIEENAQENESKKKEQSNILFFMFSGHGLEKDDAQYLCLTDTEHNNLSETAYPIPQLLEKLNRSKVDFKWVVIDACREKFTDKKSLPGETTLEEIDNPPPGVFLFQSCKSGQSSYEPFWEPGTIPEGQQPLGIFTECFVEALSGKADSDQDGNLTLMEVCKYTTELTSNKAWENHQKFQYPFFQWDGSDFILKSDLKRQRARKLHSEAKQLFGEKRYAEAKVKISEALELCPKDCEYAQFEITIEQFLKLVEQNAELERKAQEAAEKARWAEEKAKRLANIPRPTLPDVPQILPVSDGRTAGERMVKTINGVEYAFRWCPAGEFMMGSPEGELGRYDNEKQHRVRLTKGFWMLETEVTQAMWESVMGTTVSQQRDKGNKDWSLRGTGPNYPMYYVSWEECQAFCHNLRSLGLNVQLPTEAQWEYACRAGTTTSLNNGKDLTSTNGSCYNLNEVGWYDENSDSTTHIVGQKKPNAWGLYDMHGNVWEWCQDWFDSGYYAESPTSDPEGPSSGARRVIRGGGWSNFAKGCRSALRFSNTPTFRYIILGFRLVLVP
ncbi:MAG: SUMF1/EgtB/PvdO family nonheme iron enzyme [Planctomycetia bacterium]|nr:SUMF1/EgtB/PvdO family nonheme iron enzyme [Planctomycetia bacterium]